ncbi:MAG: glycosyltransferase family 4 protein [Thermoplasmata archaeon]|nr:glycosyltransferase family 4 protein [Thermoplasmata archaeon]
MRGAASARPRLLVLYPPGLPHYADREFLTLLPSVDTTFVVPEGTEGRPFVSPPSKLLGARYRRVPGLAPFTLSIAGGIPKLSELLDETTPEFVVTYEAFSALTHQVRVAARGRQFRHLIVVYETTSARTGAWGHFPLTRRWARVATQKADLVLVHTERAQQALVDSGAAPERVWMNPPGVYVRDLPDGRPSPRRDGPPRVLFLGGIRRNKGVLTLLRAIELLRGVPAEFFFVGDGPLDAKLREAARGDARIKVEGRLGEPEKQARLDSADLFVYPSEDIRLGPWVRWEEQTATSVLEAMEAGLPVLGTDSGALPEVIGDPSMVVPQRAPKELATRLHDLLADLPELGQRGRLCRARAVERFNLRRCAARAEEEIRRRFGGPLVGAAGARSPPTADLVAQGPHPASEAPARAAQARPK